MAIEDLRVIGDVVYERRADGMLYPVRRVAPAGLLASQPEDQGSATGFPELDRMLTGLGNINQMLNPVEGIGQSMDASRRMLAPDTAGWDRVSALGDMLSGVAGVAAPVAAAARAGTPAAMALMEGLLGWSPTSAAAKDTAKSIARTVAERANQRGPVPVMYSNPIMRAPFDMGGGQASNDMAIVGQAGMESFPRVSTRTPTKGEEANAPIGSLVADTSAFLRTPSAGKNMAMMTETYPGLKGLLSEDPKQTAQNIVEHMKGNIISLYDLAAKKGITEESAKWYDGANRIANELAQRFQYTPEKTSGVLAVLSPQKDWYQNVALGERIIKSHAEINPQMRWTPEMDSVSLTSGIDKDGTTAWTRSKEFEQKVRNQPYGAMETPREKAMWLRAYDEAQNGRFYREVSPGGDILDYATTNSGSRRVVVPQSWDNMAKAIRILEGDGSLASVSDELGSEHKVRNFFNNILTPSSPYDATMDTHQIAGGLLMPHGSSAPEVGHGLAGATAPKQGMPWSNTGGDVTGTTGAYGLHFDATKGAAEQLGWLPRQMQSITWEQIRALMPSTIRGNNPFVAKARSIWAMKDAGDITADQARAAIIEAAEKAGGGGMPSWVGYTGPRRSIAGGGAGLLGLVGATGLASAKEQNTEQKKKGSRQ